jgi:hypothetical protein
MFYRTTSLGDGICEEEEKCEILLLVINYKNRTSEEKKYA